MYPECRHIRPSGSTCSSPALKGSYWCYFHARMHQRQTILHSRRLPDGRFAPAETVDTYAVVAIGSGDQGEANAAVTGSTSLDLPPIEDAASIQLALVDVLQALAANQLEPKRAGLLLYGLQVASANIKHKFSDGDIRTVTHTDDGTPLAPQNYGFDLEDFADVADED